MNRVLGFAHRGGSRWSLRILPLPSVAPPSTQLPSTLLRGERRSCHECGQASACARGWLSARQSSKMGHLIRSPPCGRGTSRPTGRVGYSHGNHVVCTHSCCSSRPALTAACAARSTTIRTRRNRHPERSWARVCCHTPTPSHARLTYPRPHPSAAAPPPARPFPPNAPHCTLAFSFTAVLRHPTHRFTCPTSLNSPHRFTCPATLRSQSLKAPRLAATRADRPKARCGLSSRTTRRATCC